MSERLAPLWATLGALLLAAGVGLPSGWFALAGLACLALACRVPGEGVRLLGPVFRFELARLTRTRRVLRWRTLVGVGIFLAALDPVVRAGQLDIEGAARLAWVAETTVEGVFVVLWAAIPAVAMLRVPALVAAERRDGRLAFVLVTDLRSREVVLGRTAGVLAEVGCLGLAAVPVLTLMTLLGGTEPAALLPPLTLLASTTLTIAGMGVLASVLAGGPVAAASGAWAATAALGVGLWWAVGAPGLFPGGAGPAEAWANVRPVLAGQVGIAVACAALAAARLREAGGCASPIGHPPTSRPPLDDARPILWRERSDFAAKWGIRAIGWALRRARADFGGGWIGLARGGIFGGRLGLLVAIGAMPAVFALCNWLKVLTIAIDDPVWNRTFGSEVWISGAVLVSFHLLWLGLAVARRMDEDRRSGMWDALRLVPLTPRELIAQKRAAAWRGGRRGFLLWLALAWTGVAAGGWMRWTAVPVLVTLTGSLHHLAVCAAIRFGVSGPSATRSVMLRWGWAFLGTLALSVPTRGIFLGLNPVAPLCLLVGTPDTRLAGDAPFALGVGLAALQIAVALGCAATYSRDSVERLRDRRRD